MKVLTSEKLSENKYKTAEGYLICGDAILARIGIQKYYKSELFSIFNGENSEVDVYREESEVFDEKTKASFENKPVTIEHPNEFVDINNHTDLAVGFVRDVKKATINGEVFLIGNLIITDKEAINTIEQGKKYLSCGYECDVEEIDGKYYQKNIRGNHVALCDNPRAGNTMIQDARALNEFKLLLDNSLNLLHEQTKKIKTTDDLKFVLKMIEQIRKKL